eukprot:CAMPEP_0116146424 /NCGR_PEP_ID=MMETSP0329-20121206/17157_1 /TAXON_ID=697910 /ORGANISM="Pseudo-nitzschia arenysensis, Strain B593" /LENGTH=763 /DNA_ID=CAMNT_0003642171 /DNA_START=243 /DNA_END=2534 /DNA_ORIENTATION=-
MMPRNTLALVSELEDPSSANDKFIQAHQYLRNGDKRSLQKGGEEDTLDSEGDTEGETTTTVDDEDGGDGETTENANDEDDSDGETTPNVDGEEETTEILAPGDNADSGDKLPFLTDDDVKCMDATADFRSSNAGLASAIKTFEDSQVLDKNEEDGVDIMGYSGEAVEAMKSACGLKMGHWAFVKGAKFTCVIAGMETIAMHVHNFGSCLAKTDECIEMDPISLLRADLVDMGFNCWEDEDAAGGDSVPPSSEEAGAEGESGEGAEENVDVGGTDEDTETAKVDTGDADGIDEDTETPEGENEDEEGKEDSDQKEDEEPDQDTMLTGLGSESDQQCMGDTLAFTSENTELAAAVELYSSSINIENFGTADMEMSYDANEADKLKAACSDVDGYFSFFEEETLLCEMMSVEMHLKLSNLADCRAATEECKNMHPLTMLQDNWKSMGMTCTFTAATNKEDTTSSTTNTSQPNKSDKDDNQEDIGANEKDSTSSTTNTTQPENGDSKPSAEEKEDTPSSTTNTTKPDESDKYDNEQDSDEDNAFFKALGLTESEISCMSDSTTFIENSTDLANATTVYQKSVIMTDPTRIGYSTASAHDMEQVCEEQGGSWSFIKSGDVTCTIKGRDRCLNVYNFGNCIASSSECQSMDPYVLVRGFFFEVLDFSCKAGCETHQNTAGHSPSSAPHNNSPYGHTNNGNNLSSKQNYGNKSNGDSSLPAFTMIAIVVGVVAAVGLFGFFRYKSSRRERNSTSSYEMTDISDLGFSVFT